MRVRRVANLGAPRPPAAPRKEARATCETRAAARGPARTWGPSCQPLFMDRMLSDPLDGRKEGGLSCQRLPADADHRLTLAYADRGRHATGQGIDGWQGRLGVWNRKPSASYDVLES